MGGGEYPATCPACGATNTLFDTKVTVIDGFELVPVEGSETI